MRWAAIVLAACGSSAAPTPPAAPAGKVDPLPAGPRMSIGLGAITIDGGFVESIDGDQLARSEMGGPSLALEKALDRMPGPIVIDADPALPVTVLSEILFDVTNGACVVVRDGCVPLARDDDPPAGAPVVAANADVANAIGSGDTLYFTLPDVHMRVADLAPLLAIAHARFAHLFIAVPPARPVTVPSFVDVPEVDQPPAAAPATGETITITRKEVLLEATPIVLLQQGEIDPAEMTGGARGTIIAKLQAHATQLPVTIVADRSTPWRTVARVIASRGVDRVNVLVQDRPQHYGVIVIDAKTTFPPAMTLAKAVASIR